ncbi:MAG: SAM-dependent methyltransferase [Bacillota bacterium]
MMVDRAKIEAFWQRRAQIDDPELASHFKHDDAGDLDVAFVEQYLKPDTRLLDLGAGPCRMVNRLEPQVAFIRAVEKQEGFSRFCVASPKVEFVVRDVVGYRDEDTYDVITIFGVMNYVTVEEALQVYRDCYTMLRPGGFLLVKHASGVDGDVVVDTFSETVGDWYHAIYRHVDTERQLLEQAGFTTTVVDIYPARLNPWTNTHFYAYVGRKPAE